MHQFWCLDGASTPLDDADAGPSAGEPLWLPTRATLSLARRWRGAGRRALRRLRPGLLVARLPTALPGSLPTRTTTTTQRPAERAPALVAQRRPRRGNVGVAEPPQDAWQGVREDVAAAKRERARDDDAGSELGAAGPPGSEASARSAVFVVAAAERRPKRACRGHVGAAESDAQQEVLRSRVRCGGRGERSAVVGSAQAQPG